MAGIKIFVLSAALVAGLFASGTARAAGPERFEPMCRHFENRARFKRRAPNAELVVHFAESCQLALGDLRRSAPGSPGAALARTYLEALRAYKRVTIALLVRQIWAAPTADSGLDAAGNRQMGLSPAGEYLIARHMGLVGAYGDWAAAAGFRLTARR